MLQRLILTFLLILPLGIMPAGAWAKDSSLSLVGELDYGKHWAEDGGVRSLDADYFTQQYSLLVKKKGQLARGQGGRYDFALGYEWNSLSSKLNDVETDIDTGKVLFRGDVRIEPGGLPFRLHLYSEDMHRSTFISSNVDSIFNSSPTDSFNLEGPINNLSNGQHIRSGATLVVGIRNGHYQGRYRDVLSNFPRLLIDYEEIFVRDLKSSTPQEYRDRNLAFVSLNKKDNWFHYRLFTHRDAINPLQDFDETIYMLGTVDHTYRRQWVNLTNWIKLSADGSYTTSRDFDALGETTKRYDMNLFTTAARGRWNATNFNTFSREVDIGLLRKELEVPLFVQGQIDRDTAWRLRFVGHQEKRNQLVSATETDEANLFASSRIDMFKRAQFILSPQLETELKRGDFGEGHAVRAGFELYSNRDRRPKHHLFGSYSVAQFGGTGPTGFDTEFWEQVVRARIESELSLSVRAGFEQKFIYGTGTLDREITEYVTPESDLGLTLSQTSVEKIDGDVVRSTSRAFIEHSVRSWRNRLEVTYDFLSNPNTVDSQVIAEHRLRYDRRTFLADVSNRMVWGGEFAGGNIGSGGVLEASDNGAVVDMSYEHRTRLNYTPSRAVDAGLSLNYDWRDSSFGPLTHMLLTQDYKYSFFTVNGIVRKLAQLQQKLEYERFVPISGDHRSATIITLAGEYYPTRIYYVGGRVRYDLRNPEDTGALTWYASTGANFQKLQVGLDYAYGTRTAGVSTPDRVEQRWEVKVKKIF
jgi:hypothetical protein